MAYNVCSAGCMTMTLGQNMWNRIKLKVTKVSCHNFNFCSGVMKKVWVGGHIQYAPTLFRVKMTSSKSLNKKSTIFLEPSPYTLWSQTLVIFYYKIFRIYVIKLIYCVKQCLWPKNESPYQCISCLHGNPIRNTSSRDTNVTSRSKCYIIDKIIMLHLKWYLKLETLNLVQVRKCFVVD